MIDEIKDQLDKRFRKEMDALLANEEYKNADEIQKTEFRLAIQLRRSLKLD